MAVCEDCEQEMLTAASCTVDELMMRGERFPRQRAFHPTGRDGRCGDCGIQAGGLHHLGCDLEPCPRCGRQLLSCGCAWADDETEELLALVGGTIVHPPHLRGTRLEDRE